ncbi:MAG: aldehyde dehydrogenase [Oculatellaceae cyanobacterium Prado106]|nr:aldehyde dehydrogenase [Oculatellaceae cyanobacterium Prado106]
MQFTEIGIQNGKSQTPIQQLIRQQRDFFQTGQTQDLAFRRRQLKALQQATLNHEAEILAALKADLGKPVFEAYAADIGAIREIRYALKNLTDWAKPRRVPTALAAFPARSEVRPEPLGLVLIISPWNYPFQLFVVPLVSAIAAGNCAIVKPSELAPQTSRAIANLIRQTFEPQYISVVEGGVETSQALLQERFDHIFFTGGTAIGKVVMTAAAQHLTPVTLELGGKSPCIVDRYLHLQHAARCITWGKFLNAGQTCVAPDYLLVHRSIKTELLAAIAQNLQTFYGANPAQSPDYARIVSARHFERLVGLLEGQKIVVGGERDAGDRYIAPTVLDGVSWDDAVMQEEIFGPILPILEYEDLGEAIAQINARPKPLALYLFSTDKATQNRVLRETASGGVGINEMIIQAALPTLPFGGVGLSGMGKSHGKAGFDAFSNAKGIVSKPAWFDLKLRYAPYGNRIRFLKWLFR